MNMKKMSIRTRIIVMVSVPLLLVLGGGVMTLYKDFQARSLARDMNRNAVCFQAASELVTEIQRERGRTSLFLSKQLSEADLGKQRPNYSGRH